MAKFIVRALFVLCPIAVLTVLLVSVTYRTELEVLKNDLRCPTNIVAAVVGDSRVEVYFNPEDIPWLRNFGLSATPFVVTAHKARMIAEQNPHLGLIIVDVWPGTFFSSLDVPFAVSASSAPYSVSIIELMTRKDMPPFGDGFEIRVANGIVKPGISHLIHGLSSAVSNLTGGFLENNKYISKWLVAGHEYNGPFGPPKSPWQFKDVPTGGEIVLEHLLEDLKEKGVKVVLTTTPLLWYDKRYSLESRAYFERRMHEISVKHGVPWLNWMNDYQDEMALWADGTHLNHIGAKAFSREKRLLLEVLLNERFRSCDRPSR